MKLTFLLLFVLSLNISTVFAQTDDAQVPELSNEETLEPEENNEAIVSEDSQEIAPTEEDNGAEEFIIQKTQQKVSSGVGHIGVQEMEDDEEDIDEEDDAVVTEENTEPRPFRRRFQTQEEEFKEADYFNFLRKKKKHKSKKKKSDSGLDPENFEYETERSSSGIAHIKLLNNEQSSEEESTVPDSNNTVTGGGLVQSANNTVSVNTGVSSASSVENFRPFREMQDNIVQNTASSQSVNKDIIPSSNTTKSVAKDTPTLNDNDSPILPTNQNTYPASNNSYPTTPEKAPSSSTRSVSSNNNGSSKTVSPSVNQTPSSGNNNPFVQPVYSSAAQNNLTPSSNSDTQKLPSNYQNNSTGNNISWGNNNNNSSSSQPATNSSPTIPTGNNQNTVTYVKSSEPVSITPEEKSAIDSVASAEIAARPQYLSIKERRLLLTSDTYQRRTKARQDALAAGKTVAEAEQIANSIPFPLINPHDTKSIENLLLEESNLK